MTSRPDATPQAADGRDGSRQPLAAAVARCQADAGFLAALRHVYAGVDAAIDARGWACKACGACCDFTRSEHRLYVSVGELSLLTAAALPPPRVPGRCPYQLDGRCTMRPVRALGCRLYFCDPARRESFQQDYERYHSRIRRLHDAGGLPYAYVELTAGLAELFPARPC